MSRAYYNEIDPYAAQWLRNLVAAGHIAPGEVDERSIVDVSGDDLAGFTQCHFFAGIGGWSHALRLAGWPDDRPVWTGSCPCQPFSAAGKQGGFDDARHLWPSWFRLISERRPGVIFGEQVASPAGLGWLDLVQSDMEGAGYAIAANDLCAAGVGAPHIRQRLWFVADAAFDGGRALSREPGTSVQPQEQDRGRGISGELADADGGDTGTEGLQRSGEHGQRAQDAGVGDIPESRLGDTLFDGNEPIAGNGSCSQGEAIGVDGDPSRAGATTRDAGSFGRPSPLYQPWATPDWLLCRGGKWRPVESGTFPLVNGVSGGVDLVRTVEKAGATVQETHRYSRVGALRGFGNAIVPQVAAAFIRAYDDVTRSTEA